MYKLIKTEGNARRAEFVTPHGTFQTPAFMNVATGGAIKGGVSALDLKNLKCQIQLCNTYHLHIRPGDTKVKELGGLHKFTRWDVKGIYTRRKTAASLDMCFFADKNLFIRGFGNGKSRITTRRSSSYNEDVGTYFFCFHRISLLCLYCFSSRYFSAEITQFAPSDTAVTT